MEPSAAIFIIETDLRFLAADAYAGKPERTWMTSVLGEAAVVDLDAKMLEEAKQRSPARVPQNLLDYTSLHQIRKCIDAVDWGKFAPALGKKKDFDALLDQVGRYRNGTAHSREFLPYEEALLEGIAGLIRTRVTIHRSTMDRNSKHYPAIESARDSFGTVPDSLDPLTTLNVIKTNLVLRVGETVTFAVRGWDAQGRVLKWRLLKGLGGQVIDEQEGSDATLTWKVTEADVNVNIFLKIDLESSGSFHRHGSVDQSVLFQYEVDPPD